MIRTYSRVAHQFGTIAGAFDSFEQNRCRGFRRLVAFRTTDR